MSSVPLNVYMLSDEGNIELGGLFVLIGLTGFALLKISEKRKDKK